MKTIKTEDSNFTYLGPTPEIMDLPCELVEEKVNGGYVKSTYSVWSLTRTEREMIAAGANVKLGIVGMHPIPPVSLEVVIEGAIRSREVREVYEEWRISERGENMDADGGRESQLEQRITDALGKGPEHGLTSPQIHSVVPGSWGEISAALERMVERKELLAAPDEKFGGPYPNYRLNEE